MAVITEKLEVPARTVTRVKALKCELCGKQTPNGENGDKSKGAADVDEVTIERRKGWSVDGSADFQHTIVDLCPDCFTNKLLPWLRSMGAEVREEKSDW